VPAAYVRQVRAAPVRAELNACTIERQRKAIVTRWDWTSSGYRSPQSDEIGCALLEVSLEARDLHNTWWTDTDCNGDI